MRSSRIVGRRPQHTTLDFDEETQPAVVEQLCRAEYLSSNGYLRDRVVLDVGCGTGYTCRYFLERGGATRCIGLDIDREVVDSNQASLGNEHLEFQCYEPPTFPFDDHSFDVATCFEVVEHITPPQQAALVGELSRVLRPNGVAILSTPNRPVYSPDGISLNPDHIHELDNVQFGDLLRPSFGKIEFLGQRATSARALRKRQQRHIFSHQPVGLILRRLQVPTVLRQVRTLMGSNATPFRVMKSRQEIRPGVDDQSLVQLAVCREPIRDCGDVRQG